MLTLSPETIKAQVENLAKHKAEIKRQIRLAAKSGATVPYTLATLIDSGASAATIRKVYRAK